MSSQPIAVVGTGMVTAVGLDTKSSSAAIRAAVDNFQETAFLDAGGERIQGSEVPLERPWRGVAKLARMLARALEECTADPPLDLSRIPVMLCLAEPERAGRRPDLGEAIAESLEEQLGFPMAERSRFIEVGRVGGLVALSRARDLLYEMNAGAVIVAGVDSLLTAPALKDFERQERLLTSQNSNGFIPGEAAGAVLLQKPGAQGTGLKVTGLGYAVEEATLGSGKPLRADGLTKAARAAFEQAGTSMANIDFRIADVTGEHYWFKETALLVSRLLRDRKETFPLWHLTDTIGEVGAAITPLSISHAIVACRKDFADGRNILYHGSNDDGKRAAAVMNYG